MIELDKDNFDAKVLGSRGIVVVDFWGPTCGRCIDMMPKVEALEEEFKGKAEFGKVNIMGNRRLAMREQVMGLPTILVYKDGKKAESFVVDFTVEDLRNKLKELAG
jgi:thioredoxin 1